MKTSNAPLAEKMRPKSLENFIGQEHISDKNSLIRRALEKDTLFSMILWGPPGCGKTSLAKIIASKTSSAFFEFSAVLSGVKQIREVIEKAEKNINAGNKRSVLFVDEIHRFNKAQQDAFLPHVESGLITLIGATTQNPSFEIIPPLLSRCRVITLNPLSADSLKNILKKALYDSTTGFGEKNIEFEKKALRYIANISEGDARFALNTLEAAVLNYAEEKKEITLKELEKILTKKSFLYDKSGEQHYNLISAFHKSLRGSDPDAALYWLVRMLKSGEDPLYIGRRMVRFASEDIGNADPNALNISLAAVEAYRFLGSPEGELALAQAAIYLGSAPKSAGIYAAFNNATDTVNKSGSLPVPMHIRNAPTMLMKNLGYGKNYKYPYNFKNAHVAENYLPDQLKNNIFYFPTTRGYEKIIKDRLDKWREFKKKQD
ncbi:MAG: replication-associated recombination protein A [Deltaproteobacteria bacterium]|nr:replication-associated recombination protein A [Deltaproteobacteria bacterium]